MAKAGLREQSRLSGANRNALIAGGIMANTAEIFNFPVPDVAQKEPRVADLDDGYTRIANELLEAVMLAGLTQHQLLVFLAVMRKTYGFNKKLDWVSNEQLSELILVVDGKVWRTVYYRFATREEREGKVSTNLIFKECRQSAAMKRVLRVYKRTSMGTQ